MWLWQCLMHSWKNVATLRMCLCYSFKFFKHFEINIFNEWLNTKLKGCSGMSFEHLTLFWLEANSKMSVLCYFFVLCLLFLGSEKSSVNFPMMIFLHWDFIMWFVSYYDFLHWDFIPGTSYRKLFSYIILILTKVPFQKVNIILDHWKPSLF